ncbi:LINE-1 retrotransposable element ORF2 protein, partial [Picochlorum sp. SENEW3]
SRRGAAEVVHKVFDRGTGAGRVRVKRVWLGRRRRGRVGSGFLPVMFEIEPPGVSARRMQDLVAVFVGDHRRAGSYAGAGGRCVLVCIAVGVGGARLAGASQASCSGDELELRGETHVGLTDRQVEVPGYYTLSAPVQDDLAGCWGMCMLVARGLHVRALDTGDANVQAVLAGEGVVVDAQCVLVNVYIPTRGAGGKETRRTQVVKRLGSLVQQWYARYGDALAVVVMGDFNCPDRGDLDELLTRGEVMLHPGPLHMTVVANQHPTRVLKCKDGVKETTLDHFMVNTPARKLFNKHATSLLSCREDLQSDHAPIVVGFRSPKAKQRQRTREEGPPSASGEEALVEGRQEAAGAGAGLRAGDAVESTHRVGATPLVDLDLVAAREQQIVHDPEWLHVAVVIHQDREGGQLRQGLEGAEAPPSIANPPEVFYRTAMRVLRRHGCIKDPRDRRDRSRLQDKDELGQRKRKRKRMSLAVANAVQKRIRIRKRIEKKSSARTGAPSTEEDAQALREATTKAKELKAKARQRGWTEATRKATEAAKRGDWEQVWKYIKKTVKKQVGSPLGVPLRDPATGQLVYDEDSKTGVLMAHFAHLAVDPHPQSREWWEQQHPLPEEGECKELDVEVSWPEVSTALARATTSKAPGLDGLPNEVLKMCKGPPTAMEPPNPMAAALLEQCQAMLDGQVSQELNTSVLVALDKPGKDAQEVGNKRGISLMPTLLKLATKIAANRIQNHTPEVAKEQAGFRPGEECLQNVAALHEVCHLRRHHWGQPTYVAFMDLKKAFDTVPHAAMLHVLHAKGVRGKYTGS